MKVLVTGGCGFIGSTLVERLIGEGHDVCILDVAPSQRNDGVEVIQQSLADDGFLGSVLREEIHRIRPEVVYHLAGFANIDKVKSDPVGTVRSNVLATANLLDACRQHLDPLPRIIFTSSVYVYSEHGHLYTTTKKCAEDLIKDFHTLYGLPYTILRLGTVYGEHSREQDVVSIFVKQALAGKPITIHGDGRQRRRFLYIGDAVEALIKAMNPKLAEDKTLTIVGPRAVTVNELALIVKDKIGGSEVQHLLNEQREDDIREEIISSLVEQNNIQVLGWTPCTEIEEGIQKMIKWYKTPKK